MRHMTLAERVEILRRQEIVDNAFKSRAKQPKVEPVGRQPMPGADLPPGKIQAPSPQITLPLCQHKDCPRPAKRGRTCNLHWRSQI